jgi:hypothetical protein
MHVKLQSRSQEKGDKSHDEFPTRRLLAPFNSLAYIRSEKDALE